MASVTRSNGGTGAHGTTVSVAQLKAFEIDAINSLAAKGGVDSTIEAIVREFQPLMYVSTGTAGKIFMIVDGHGVDAASMQIRLRNLGTVDSIALTSATVTLRELDEFDAT
jgi:hypothetical protein